MHASSLARGALALALVTGCPGSQSDAPETPAPDASAPDAGDDVDAPGEIDAPIVDATTIDAMTGPVTVHVTKDGVPLAGVTVIAHDAAGEPLEPLTVTNNAGMATTQVPVGGMVTVLSTDCGGFSQTCIRSIAGVVPGDAIVVHAPTSTISDYFTTRVRLATLVSGADHYTASNGCATGTDVLSNGDVLVQRRGTTGCFNDPANPRLQAMLIARASGVPVAFARALDAEVPADGDHITVGAWSDATQPYTVTFDDQVDTTQWTISVGERQGRAYWSLLSRTPTTRAPLTAVRPGEPGTGVHVSWRAALADGETSVQREHRGPADETTFELDTSEPQFTTATAAIEPGGRPSVSWALDPAPGDLDAALITLEADNPYGRVRWVFLAAPSATILFPRLPDSLALHRPTGLSSYGRLAMYLYGASTWNGFADAHSAFLVDSFESRYGAVTELDAQQFYIQKQVP